MKDGMRGRFSKEPQPAGARTPDELAAIRISRLRYSDEPVAFRSQVIRWIYRRYQERLTPPGKWLLWITLAFTLYGASTLDIQAYIPFCYLFGLWVVAAIVSAFSRLRLSLRAHCAERVCVGETLPVEVEVTQLGRRGVSDLEVVPHRLPFSVTATPAAPLLPLDRGDTQRVRLGLRCERRGVYVLHGWQVRTSFPLGIAYGRRVFPEERLLLVYPAFTPLTGLDMRVGRRYQAGGILLAANLGDSFEYVGNREFRQGDNIRDIDWRSTARLGMPVVREYREEYFLRVIVMLDTYVPPRAEPGRAECLERAVSLCAAVCDFMARQEYVVDLFAAGPNLYHLTAGRSLANLDQILDILACVKASSRESFETIEPEIQEHLARVPSIACIFLDWDEPRQRLVGRLRDYGLTVKVLVARDAPCTLDPGLDPEVRVIDRPAFEGGLQEL